MKVYTALGEMDIESTSLILSHEHILWFYNQPPASEREAVFQAMYNHYIPMYREIVEEYGCNTLIEHSPDFIDLEMAQHISRESGMNIVLATGCYLDSWIEGYRPSWFHDNPPEKVAKRFIHDLTVGMKGTDIKAAYIKVAIAETIIPEDEKLLKAAALAHKETGVCISIHALNPETRLWGVNILEGAGVPPHKIFINHADAKGSVEESLMLVKRGFNLNYTIWGIVDAFKDFMPDITEEFSAHLTKKMIEAGYVNQILFSVDYQTSYSQEKGFDYFLYGIPKRDTRYAFSFILPRLKKVGVSQAQIEIMMKANPRKLMMRG